MKRRWMRGVPVALAGVLAGLWLGLPAAPERGATPARKTARGEGRNPSEAGAARGDRRTHAALVRDLVHAKGLPAAALRGIESATNRELRDLLRAIAVTERPGHPYRPGPEKQRAALMAAAAELFRREGAKALEWAAGVENLDLSLALMTAAAGQDPAVMKEWLAKPGPHRETGFNSMLIATAEREAALKSAEDLLAVERLFSGSLESDFRGFAEGFDFHAYLKATRSPYAGEKAYGFWAARDPEAAARWLRDDPAVSQHPDAGAFYLLAMKGRAGMTNDTEAAEWICGLVADLAGQARDGAIGGLVGHFKPSLDLMWHLPSDSDRVTFAAVSLQNHSLAEAMPVVKALPTPAARTEAVGRWVERMGDLGAETLDEMMEHLDLPGDQREELRAKLRPER